MTEIGGGESNLICLAKTLSKTIDITLFCSGKVKQKADEEGIKTSLFYTFRRWFSAIPVFSCSNKIRKKFESFDLVHAYSINALPVLFFIKPPLVWTNHGFWEKPHGLRARIIDWFVARIVCVSNDVYKISEFAESKKRLIYLGSNFCVNKTVPKNHKEKNLFRFVCVGRFQRIKGQDMLVRAATKLSQEISCKIQITFVGDVNGKNPADIAFKNEVVKLATEAKNENLSFIFKGFCPNVRPHVEQADILVVPSRYESFSMVSIEALSCGVPVIAPDTGGPAEIINNTDIGLLFKPGSDTDSKRCMKYVLQNHNNFNTNSCLLRAQEFSVQNQAAKHISIYKEILKC